MTETWRWFLVGIGASLWVTVVSISDPLLDVLEVSRRDVWVFTCACLLSLIGSLIHLLAHWDEKLIWQRKLGHLGLGWFAGVLLALYLWKTDSGSPTDLIVKTSLLSLAGSEAMNLFDFYLRGRLDRGKGGTE